MPADLNDYFNKGKKSSGNGGGGNKINFQPPSGMDFSSKKMNFFYILIALVVIIFLARPFVIIESGEVGVKATAGKYESTPLYAGFHILIPFLQKVTILDTREKIINYGTASGSNYRKSSLSSVDKVGIINKPSISVVDKRNLTSTIDVTVQYKLRASMAPQTLSTYGLEWENKIISPVITESVQNIVGKYTVEELPMIRDTISQLIKQSITEKVNLKEGSPAEVMDLILKKIVLPQNIKEQIEQVQVAQQQAQRAKNEVARAVQEAEKIKALEQGKADAREIEAKGIASATLIEAKAQAQANKVISDSLTVKLLELEQMKVQGKFNDALSVNKDAKIFLTPGGAVPNIWVDTKDKMKTTNSNR
ncbi:MAG: Membrane protease family protein HP0248 [uncultured Campylobacterales bacterium]|uniref:Membrane protease family protein HP0248 n=1 Tax=uncultured Campylobacterales bacterium TaxID=352960 RepID=A0A6S6SF59_9BACT|nr:MAG: Membrane protease family protein HP0248 [uncultured Campylobacterales bacterium]